jgi:hypothetical protein
MANMDKILKKMRTNLLNWNIGHFETIARHYDIEVRKTSGSHVIFTHEQWVESLSVPSRRPIKPIYVKKFLKMIDVLEGE